MEDMKVVPMNIIFPLRGEGDSQEVLLAKKTRKIGRNKLSGFGGKIEGEDTPEQSSSTELAAECGLFAKPEDFELIAIIDFYIHKSDAEIVLNKCFVYFIRAWSGEPISTEEMINPKWYKISGLNYSETMLDARFWMPQVLAGVNIYGEFHYNADRTEIIHPPLTRVLRPN